MAQSIFFKLSWRARGSYLAHLFKAVFKQHHPWMRPLFARFVPIDGVIFDIGGHSGQFAKIFAGVAPRGRVYSFEPGAYARSILRQAIRLNGLSNVAVVAKGLGDAPGSLTLSTPLKTKGTFSFGLAHLGGSDDLDHRRGGGVHIEDVEVTTIDAFAAEQGLERLDFIKADVEGWELRILAGGAETIQRFRPVILVELVGSQLSRAGDTVEAAWALLQGWGYRPHMCFDDKTLTPLDGIRESDIYWLPDERTVSL